MTYDEVLIALEEDGYLFKTTREDSSSQDYIVIHEYKDCMQNRIGLIEIDGHVDILTLFQNPFTDEQVKFKIEDIDKKVLEMLLTIIHYIY